MTDSDLLELVLDGDVLGTGIGGTRSLVAVDDVPLFVKRVPLTDLERLPANVGSTANLFNLPSGCNYGVGSPAFGAWREVAANSMTTNWVASGSCGAFPMLHHWRALTTPAFVGPLPHELGDIETLVAHWHGSSAVRRRVEAIADSSAAVVLIFEYIPRLLSDDLDASARSGDMSDAALERVHSELIAATTFMNSSGLLHFDTHFGNVLADEPDIYLTDLGLASSASFDLD
ncbi:MAG: protein kinase family protein, partial [Ilumatobacteraceae bacterium]